jgi:ankyrin repeat protein
MITIRDNNDGFEMAKWVIEQGADVSIKCPQGTCLHNAVEFGNPDIIGHILKINPSLITSTDTRNFTPLILAANEVC